MVNPQNTMTVRMLAFEKAVISFLPAQVGSAGKTSHRLIASYLTAWGE